MSSYEICHPTEMSTSHLGLLRMSARMTLMRSLALKLGDINQIVGKSLSKMKALKCI